MNNADDWIILLLSGWTIGCAIWSMVLVIASVRVTLERNRLLLEQRRWVERCARGQSKKLWRNN